MAVSLRSQNTFNNVKHGSLELRLPIFIVLLATVLSTVNLFTSVSGFPYSPDSASYIEQARNLVSQGRPLSTPWGLYPVNVDYVPPAVFPPGFPIAIAFLALFGIEAQFGAVLISSVAAVLLPVTIFLSFYRVIGRLEAAIAALLGSLSGGVLAGSGMALTDCFALLLAVCCVGIIINSEKLRWIAVAGLLAGYGYSVRNALVALVVAPIIYFVLLQNSRSTILRSLAFLGGAACVILPLFSYNIAVYHALNPYSMPESTVTLTTNILKYFAALSADMTGYWAFMADNAAAITTMLFFLSLWLWILFYVWPGLSAKRKKAILLSSLYVSVGTTVVILSRTRYQWGEDISWRHTLQYIPFLFVILLAALGQKKAEFSKAPGWMFWYALVALLALSQVGQVLRHSISIFRPSLPNPAFAIFEYSSSNLCGARDAFVVSNWAWVFRIRCNQPARHPGPQISSDLMGGIKEISDLVQEKELRLGLFPGAYGFGDSDFPFSEIEVKQLSESGWTVVKNGPQGTIIFRPKQVMPR